MIEQPHFEDELTNLTARPVVPLKEIEASIKHRRRWFLGGAFAIAMLLGAASALVSAYFKLRNIPDPEIQTLSVSSVVPEPVVENALPVAETTPEPPKPTPRNRENTDRTVRTNHRVIDEPQVNEEDELRRIRGAVLVDRWEERRARRVERRERRRAQHRNRDLSNIDEIFEGRHRP